MKSVRVGRLKSISVWLAGGGRPIAFKGVEVATSATGGLAGLHGGAEFGGDGVSPTATAHWLLVWRS